MFVAALDHMLALAVSIMNGEGGKGLLLEGVAVEVSDNHSASSKKGYLI